MSKWILIEECATISDICRIKHIAKSFGSKVIDYIVNRDKTCSILIEYYNEKTFPAIELFINGK